MSQQRFLHCVLGTRITCILLACLLIIGVVYADATARETDAAVSALAASVEGVEEAGAPYISQRQDGSIRSFFTGPDSGVVVPGTSRGEDVAVIAATFLDLQRTALGIYSPHITFTPLSTRNVLGRNCVRFEQYYKGIPVYDSHVMVHIDSEGRVGAVLNDTMVNTGALDDGTLSTEPTLSAEEAIQFALAAAAEIAAREGDADAEPPTPDQFETVAEPLLKIFDPVVVGKSGDTTLVWETVVRGIEAPLNEGILIDASNGCTVFSYMRDRNALDRDISDQNNTRSGFPPNGTMKRQDTGGYPYNAPTSDPNNPYTAGTEIVDVDLAWDHLEDTHDFYSSHHGRDSFDGYGATIDATTRFCFIIYSCPFLNAFYLPDYGVFGFGSGMVADDIVSHEFTHAVTCYESNLTYAATHSGAINECLSDVWGELVDLTNGRGTDTAGVRWQIGEDSALGSIRDMMNPPAYDDPDRLGSPLFYTGGDTNTYVHTNSGVGNKLCALLTDGGTFNGYTMTGLGIDAVAARFYAVQTGWLGPSSDYFDLGDGLIYFAWLEGTGYKATALAVRAVEINTDMFFGVKDDQGTWLLQMDDRGDVYVLKGSIYTYASLANRTPSPSIREFLVKDPSGEVVARLRSDTGNLYLKGTTVYAGGLTHENQTREFVVKRGLTWSLTDQNGNLKYRRWLF